jgi:pimeloyl-ACP methyl ester carboxylesterase
MLLGKLAVDNAAFCREQDKVMARHRTILSAFVGACVLTHPLWAAVPTAAAGASLTPAADQYVVAGGVRFRVRQEGPAKAPPIVLIHGFTFSLESWDGWAADLSRDHRVIRFDLAGHGFSGPDPKGRYDTDTRVHQLAALLDKLHVRKAIIAGNSFGGLIAWNFAAAHPDRVSRLILVDTAAFSINGVTEKPVAVPPIMQAYLMNPTPAGVKYSAGNIFAHPERLSAARLEQMQAMIARNGTALVAHLEQFTLPDPKAGLAKVKAPTLVLWGRADKLIPVEQAEPVAAAIPNAKLIVYDDVGHALHEEATQATIADVRNFLLQNQKGGSK